MDFVKLTNNKLSVEDVTGLVTDESCGAISLFIGTTRECFEDRIVTHLEYEAYETMAITTIKNICSDVRKLWPSVHHIAVYHRLGSVPVKESSVIIAASSPHRSESMKATEFCIDMIKKTVPIWKKEMYEDGSEWKENKESKSNTHPPRIKLFKLETESKVDAPSIHSSLIQIKANNAEVQRRVDAFFKRKRDEINESNVRDYCGQIFGNEEEFSCCRVDARLRRTKNSKSHLQINRANNIFWRDRSNFDYMKKHIPKNGIEERICNIESQLSLSSPIPLDIYTRIKYVEDRLLFLESVSPEYIKVWENKAVVDRKRVKRTYSIDDIDYLITQLETKKSKEESQQESSSSTT